MSRRVCARWLVGVLLGLVGLVVFAPAAGAHPLGNFTVNSFSGVRVSPDAVMVDVVVDSAEIPTVQEFPEVNAGSGVSAAAAQRFAAAECARLRPGVELRVGGDRVGLRVAGSRLRVLAGQGGLHTMRLSCRLSSVGAVDTVGRRVEYVDANALGRTGWREITVAGDGVDVVGGSARTESVSQGLRAYPQDLLASPLDDRRAVARVVAGEGTVSGAGSASGAGSGSGAAGSGVGVSGVSGWFTGLVSARELGVGFAGLALVVSVGLGVLHAFAPGHGKTLMAAYLLGRRSSLRQVAVIGLTVTVTHTAGVLVLGVVLSALALTAPARIYGWLGLASGVLLVGIGVSLLRQARRSARVPVAERAADLVTAGADQVDAVPHDQHGHGHGHDQHGHGHGSGVGVAHAHGWGGVHTHPAPARGARGMIAVGFAGGMVPSPSALVVLLGGIALGRAWFGVLLVIGYGLGMALALVGTGVVLAHARDRVQRWAQTRRAGERGSGWLLRATGALPTLTAALVVVVGLGLALRSVLVL